MKYRINLQGKTYEVEVEHGQAMLLDEYETSAPAPSAPVPSAPAPAPAPVQAVEGTAVRAPLPGSVISIHVKDGEPVKKGQLLMKIEAMKMENEVLAPIDGAVRQIVVSKGALVATGDTLLVI